MRLHGQHERIPRVYGDGMNRNQTSVVRKMIPENVLEVDVSRQICGRIARVALQDLGKSLPPVVELNTQIVNEFSKFLQCCPFRLESSKFAADEPRKPCMSDGCRHQVKVDLTINHQLGRHHAGDFAVVDTLEQHGSDHVTIKIRFRFLPEADQHGLHSLVQSRISSTRGNCATVWPNH